MVVVLKSQRPRRLCILFFPQHMCVFLGFPPHFVLHPYDSLETFPCWAQSALSSVCKRATTQLLIVLTDVNSKKSSSSNSNGIYRNHYPPFVRLWLRMEPLSASLKLMKLLQVVWLAEVMAEMQMFATFWFTCVRKAAVSRSADKCVALGEVCAELPLPVPAGHDLWRGWLVKTLLPEPDNSDFLHCGHLAIKMSDPEDISSLGNEWHPHRWKCVCSICVIGMIEVIVFQGCFLQAVPTAVSARLPGAEQLLVGA